MEYTIADNVAFRSLVLHTVVKAVIIKMRRREERWSL